jgi:predicted ester cyclase
MKAIFTLDFVDHAPSGETTPGWESFQTRSRLLKNAFPDLTFAYRHIIAEGEYVVTHWLASGTHQGAFLDHAATHRRVCWHGNTIFRVIDGKITDRWIYQDSEGLIQQLREDTAVLCTLNTNLEGDKPLERNPKGGERVHLPGS